MRGNFYARVFFMIRNIVICDIIPLRSHFVSDDKNFCRYAITCIFQPWYYTPNIPLLIYINVIIFCN